MISRKEVSRLTPGTPRYVVMHGDRQLQRGKPLSAMLSPTYCVGGERNPRLAYELAKKYIEENWQRSYRKRMSLLYDDPLMKLYHEPPSEGMRKVPFTCYNWY